MGFTGKSWWNGESKSQSGAEERDSESRQVLEGVFL